MKNVNGKFLDRHLNSRLSKAILIGVATFGWVGYIVTGTTDEYKEYLKAKDNLDTLQIEYDKLTTNNGDLQTKNDELNEMIIDLQKQIENFDSQPVQEEQKEVKQPTIEQKTQQSELTLSQKNAVELAKSYLKYTSFSRTGLIEQLEYEGFSLDDSTYAVDNITVDWNEQCANTAKSYLNYTAFSRQGLYEQLEYEGFTHEQIEYGLQSVGY